MNLALEGMTHWIDFIGLCLRIYKTEAILF